MTNTGACVIDYSPAPVDSEGKSVCSSSSLAGIISLDLRVYNSFSVFRIYFKRGAGFEKRSANHCPSVGWQYIISFDL